MPAASEWANIRGATFERDPERQATRVYRAVGLQEYVDIRDTGRFRPGEGMMEGKWFADTREGVLLHAAQLYPDGSCRIVAADIPDDLLDRLFRLSNLDQFGPATYLDAEDMVGIVPILEVEGHEL